MASGSPTAADVERLAYTRSVMLEALRLYPPAWALIRTAVADDEIAGHKIKAGDRIVLCPYVMHHDAEILGRPGGVPTRALRAGPHQEARQVQLSALRRGQALLPRRPAFADGDRPALTQLLRRFRPEYVGRTPPQVAASVTLMPKAACPSGCTSCRERSPRCAFARSIRHKKGDERCRLR